MNCQLELFEIRNIPSKDKTMVEAFREFHEANPHVFSNLHQIATLMHGRRRRVSMKHLFEVLRWEYAVKTDHPEGDYRLNNNYTAFYARAIMEADPSLKNAFETRERRVAKTRA